MFMDNAGNFMRQTVSDRRTTWGNFGEPDEVAMLTLPEESLHVYLFDP